jgi:hypothetical protein
MNRLVALLVVAACAALLVPTVARTAPSAPTGLTAIALDGKVGLAWKTVSGASSYKVYRGTSAASITTLVGSPTTTSYTDATVANSTTYYYAVRASGSGDSSPSLTAQVKPVAKSCATGNAVVQENCYPGSTAWRATSTGAVSSSDTNIEGFATDDSVNAGGSIDVKINTGDNDPYRIDIYRTGYYGGTYGRLVSTIPSLSGVRQDDCQDGSGNTGLLDCSNWTTSASITTSSSWPSGTYMLHVVRTDNGNDANILFVVRNDSSTSDVLYSVPTSTYQAYNNYGDKSLYDYNSFGATTIAGTARAVKVSYDRPYASAQGYFPDPNWYATNDIVSAGFLERNGYDVTYDTSIDLHRAGSVVANHKSYVSPAHDEYWSTEMRNAVTSARNSGTGLFWMGSNQVYWKIRYEASPFSGTSNRVEVAYKSTQSGATDPVSPTGTWRDPAGANNPENALVGQMYIGDNDQSSFKLGVSVAQGKGRIWRHTELTSIANDVDLGQQLVGWEWNDRVANGAEPAGVQNFASSDVNGETVQHNGRDYQAGVAATTTGTWYRAASGAYVVSAGTNYWGSGLGNNPVGDGEPNSIIQQATINILADMSSRPTTPISGMVVDAAGGPAITSRTPTVGATGVPTSTTISAIFDKSLDPTTVTSANVILTTQAGATVASTVAYDDATKKITLTPSQALGANALYNVRLKAGASGISGYGGDLGATDVTWSFTTGAGAPPTVSSTTPASAATDVPVSSTVKAVFDRDMTASTITSSSFTLTPQVGNAVAATVTYSASTDTATLTPASALDPTRQYTATVTTAAKAADGTALAADKSWTFTTADALSVSNKVPAPLATGIAPGVIVRATFNRAVNASTITSTNVTLKTSGGSTVASTVAYDATTKTVSITPTSTLAVSSTYTVKLAAAIAATDGATLGSDVTWTFTTAASAPPAPTVTSRAPGASATGIPTDVTPTATFSRAMDATTFTGQTFLLRDPSSNVVSATVTYDSATQTARITPTSLLSPATVYTAQLTTAVRAADGTPLAATSWSFTTADCPCTLLSGTTPVSTGLDVQDGRPGSGLTYELGMKFTVDKTMRLTAVRYYKDAAETGTHVGRLWNAAGTSLGTVTFSGESASGWQQATLSSPITLTANATYTVSVGLNARFVMTAAGLSSQLNNGPLHSVLASNGVYGNAAGTFPSNSWNSSNYFVAPVVGNVTTVNTPSVTSKSPVASATSVDPSTTVTATFGSTMDASTITSSSFTLETAGGTAVPATVTYDTGTRIATLTPNATLSSGASYTARLTTALKSDDGTALPAAVAWSFSTAAPVAPTVVSTTPASSATGVATTAPVQATFSLAMDASTITSATFALTTSGGASVPAAVTYDSVTKVATLTPTGALSISATYTATISTAVKSAAGASLASAKTWSFTTAGCPCSLMAGLTPASTGLDVVDGRGAGTWTYELGTQIQVSSASTLTGIRFYKDAGETGTHVGTVWSTSGTALATVTFTGESASGWQQATFSSPVSLTAGATYTVSVGFNTRFVMSGAGLGSQLTAGPLSSVVGGNGVFGNAAGVFPSNSWNASNYFVDAVVQ